MAVRLLREFELTVDGGPLHATAGADATQPLVKTRPHCQSSTIRQNDDRVHGRILRTVFVEESKVPVAASGAI